jgi:hypothetical protein
VWQQGYILSHVPRPSSLDVVLFKLILKCVSFLLMDTFSDDGGLVYTMIVVMVRYSLVFHDALF